MPAKEKKRKKQWKIVAKMRHKREARRSEFLNSHRICRTLYVEDSASTTVGMPRDGV